MAASAGEDATSDKALPILDDALTPPDVSLMTLDPQNVSEAEGLNSVTSSSSASRPTSAYMIGHVAVDLILPESDGGHEAQSEDWTDAEIDQVRSEVQNALDWWASLEPSAHLTFTVEIHPRVPTGYEPITHNLGEEGLWIGEAMAALGQKESYYFGAVREYVNDLRDRAGSDWAFALFVVDSSEDGDGRFSDNRFAYAYLGGPYAVMTYDNSGYTVHNMEAVAAHEIGHIFHALDQYAESRMRCESTAGYLAVENSNSLAGGDCKSDQPSIMRGGIAPYNSRAIDYFARGQIGWWDSDGDGVLDPVDAQPGITAELDAVQGESDELLSFNGVAWQEPVPSPAMADITVSYIAGVGAVVDGQDWLEATPVDGEFDTVSETFRLEVGPLPPGLHTLEIQAVNSEGLASSASVTTTFVYDPVDGALNSSLRVGPIKGSQEKLIQFAGLATAAYGADDLNAPTVAVVQFQVDSGEWTDAISGDGAFDSAIEDFDILLTDLPEGLHHLTVRTIDSDGRIELNVEERQFELQPTRFTVFLPIVAR